MDRGQSGSQDSRKTMDLSGKTYVSHISDHNLGMGNREELQGRMIFDEVPLIKMN